MARDMSRDDCRVLWRTFDGPGAFLWGLAHFCSVVVSPVDGSAPEYIQLTIYIVNFRKLKFRLFENLQCKCSYNRFSDFSKSLIFQVDRFSCRCCSKVSIDFDFYPSPEQKYGLSCAKTSD